MRCAVTSTPDIAGTQTEPVISKLKRLPFKLLANSSIEAPCWIDGFVEHPSKMIEVSRPNALDSRIAFMSSISFYQSSVTPNGFPWMSTSPTMGVPSMFTPSSSLQS